MTHKTLEDALHEHFGYTSFRDGQREAISATLEGSDTLIMLPTGTGKSICYQLSGYLLEGLTVIVSPLLSLMEDQVGKMRQMGEKRVAALNSFLTFSEKQAILQSLAYLKFLFLSPEMLDQPFVLEALKTQKIALFAIDEAHCISQWGFDFRPEYLELGKARAELGYPTTMALTATATKEVEQEILDVLLLHSKKVEKVRISLDRPNIFLSVQKVDSNKEALFLAYAKELPKPGIVYFSSKKQAEESAERLNVLNIGRTEAYHSSISKDDKIKIQTQFLNGELDIICATSAFGMGIDKANIRFVIHYHVPGSPEQYLQEIGRCGRDGKPSVALLLADESGFRIHTHLIETGYPTRVMLEAAYSKLNENILKESTEVQAELSRYYAKSDLSLNETLSIIEHRQKTKQKQLAWMRRFVNMNDQCLRTTLLSYFGEPPSAQVETCCSQCQPIDVLSLFNTGADSVESFGEHEQLTETVDSWEKTIQRVFNLYT